MSNLFGRLAISALSVLTAIVVLAQPTAAVAAPYDVYVGYSDGLRGPGFFPNPWSGDPGITFQGNSPGGSFDAGAILIENTSGASLTINSVSVTINGSGAISLWTFPVTLGVGGGLIVTQTTDYNFDTSDINPISPDGTPVTTCAVTCPVVTIGANGLSPVAYDDTAHTLDTLGYDYAYNGANESFNWRLIGTCSGPGCGGVVGATPIPAAFPLFATGLGGLGLLGWRRKRKAQAAA